MAVKILQRARGLLRRAPQPAPVVELVRSPLAPPPVSLDDFTVTIDTARSRGDCLVLHLDREGEPTLHMQVHVKQFLWLCEDPEQFAAAYAQRAHWVDPYAGPKELAEVSG